MKHTNIIKAWLDGEVIEYKRENNEWVVIMSSRETTVMPAFADAGEYRIKPKIIMTIPVWRYIYKPRDGGFMVGISVKFPGNPSPIVSHCFNFVGWIDSPDGEGYSVQVK